jgi:hypothetical protein
LPNVPTHASPLVRAVVRDFEIVAGLRIASGDHDREVIYACRWAAARIGAHYAAVSNVLGGLVRRGALIDAGTMPAYGGKRGAKLYLPGGVALPPGAGAVERLVGTADPARAEPQAEAVDLGAVAPAQVDVHGVTGLAS